MNMNKYIGRIFAFTAVVTSVYAITLDDVLLTGIYFVLGALLLIYAQIQEYLYGDGEYERWYSEKKLIK